MALYLCMIPPKKGYLTQHWLQLYCTTLDRCPLTHGWLLVAKIIRVSSVSRFYDVSLAGNFYPDQPVTY